MSRFLPGSLVLLTIAALLPGTRGGGLGSAPAGQDYSALSVAVDDAWLMVVDPEGRISGYGSPESEPTTGIPHSYVYRDGLADDVTGEPAEVFLVTVGVQQAIAGAYRVIVIADHAMSSKLQVRAYSSDGSRQPNIDLPIEMEAGTIAEFRLHFSPAPGSTPRLEPATDP